MPASTQSVGSLVVDIRANLASLQADMASVKDTIAKSSRQNLFYDVHAICEAERVTGLPCWKLCQELPPPVRIIAAILFAGMIHDKPDATIADAERIIGEIGAPAVSRMVMAPFTDAIYKLTLGENKPVSQKLT